MVSTLLPPALPQTSGQHCHWPAFPNLQQVSPYEISYPEGAYKVAVETHIEDCNPQYGFQYRSIDKEGLGDRTREHASHQSGAFAKDDDNSDCHCHKWLGP